jgi:hypothetical protein
MQQRIRCMPRIDIIFGFYCAKRDFASITHLSFALPARASHFSLATA